MDLFRIQQSKLTDTWAEGLFRFLLACPEEMPTTTAGSIAKNRAPSYSVILQASRHRPANVPNKKRDGLQLQPLDTPSEWLCGLIISS